MIESITQEHNPNKYPGPNINPQKSHAEFPSLKKFPEMLKWYNTKNKNGVDIVCLGLFIHHTIWKKSDFNWDLSVNHSCDERFLIKDYYYYCY